MLALLAPAVGAQTSEIRIYKKVGERALSLFVEKPADWKSSDRRPAIVFFFGGGFTGGTPNQFNPQSTYFASRGLVGIRVEYRVLAKGDAGPPIVCIQDAKSAMRYVRAHAAELGVDPERIVGSGGSAGGHLAAFTALIEGQDDPADDRSVSCRPNALVLFNPVFDNGPGEYAHARFKERFREFSPAHNVSKAAPPTIVFFGDSDKLVTVRVPTNFAASMKNAGVRCETHIYPGVGHAFFNKEPHLTLTMIEADKFLASLGLLKGEPTLKPPPR